MQILNVVGARPNLMKIAPLMAAYQGRAGLKALLVHTGQHYDDNMSDLFFRELGIPKPDINLGVGSAPRDEQIAAISHAFVPVIERYRPDWVVVVGDVNSTVACGRVAIERGVRLAHVEAGLRSFDRTMPEELNRIETDAMSDVLFCTEQSGVDNLAREGVATDRVHLVGNVMIDTLLEHRESADRSKVLGALGLEPKGYAVLTLHRPSNVDVRASFEKILDALAEIERELTIVFPVHPRSRARVAELGLSVRLEAMKNVLVVEPLGYLDFLKLMAEARVMMTDSGGIQEETTILGVPCLTLRENTERPITVEIGTNQLVGTDCERILAGYRRVADGHKSGATMPPLWDGHAAERIVDILEAMPKPCGG